MSGASFETTLELRTASLYDIKARIPPLFTQDRVATSAGLPLTTTSAVTASRSFLAP